MRGRAFPWTVLLLAAALVFIWPIPHTISLRQLLILLFAILLAYGIAKGRIGVKFPRDLRVPVYLLVALTLWMLIVAVFLSSETAWSLSELRGQWDMSVVTLTLGAVVGTWAREDRSWQVRLCAAIFVALLVHVLYLDVNAFREYVNTGFLPRRIGGLANSLDRASLGVWVAGAFVMAEIITRLATRQKFLPIHGAVLSGLLVAIFFASYVTESRNGMIVLSLLMILSATAYVMAVYSFSIKRLAIVGAGTAVLVPLLILAVVRADDRWGTFLETIPIALDTTNNRNWLEPDKPLPSLPDGRPVNDSNYKRIAWIKEGLILVMERPWGRGFGRQIFGHALMEKYGVKKTQTHPHSSVLSLAIGAGVPGLLLWVAFCFFLIRFGYRSFTQTKSYASLVLFFLTTGFLLAVTLDSMMQDHMLQEIMFLIGLFAVLSVSEDSESRDTRAAQR